MLFWNRDFSKKYFLLENNGTSFKKCEFKNCVIWHREDKEIGINYEDYDAIVFHGLGRHIQFTPNFTPPIRRPNQRYVYYNIEPPAKHNNCPLYSGKNFYNWTITYRHDSDILYTFIRFYLKNVNSPKDPDYMTFPMVWKKPNYDKLRIPDYVMNRTKLVAWFNSNWGHAHSQRHKYVWNLAKYVPIDIYGKRQTLQCSGDLIACDEMLRKTYKFYLAFENFLCAELVTEKLLRPYSVNLVPIVYGGANYSMYAPPMSYINVDDYDSPEDLARYLLYLDEHPKEYAKYFWWKKYYKVGKWLDEEMWHCVLCKMLNDPKIPKKSYKSIDSWWNYKGACHSPLQHFGRKLPFFD